MTDFQHTISLKLKTSLKMSGLHLLTKKGSTLVAVYRRTTTYWHMPTFHQLLEFIWGAVTDNNFILYDAPNHGLCGSSLRT